MSLVFWVVGSILVGMVAVFDRDLGRSAQPFVGVLGGLVVLSGVGFFLAATFGMRRSIHDYYNTVEPMGIDLMGTGAAVLTLFFAVYYFQYHFSEIAAKKRAMGHTA